MDALPNKLGNSGKVTVSKNGKVVRIFESGSLEANQREAVLLQAELKAADPSADVTVKTLQGISG